MGGDTGNNGSLKSTDLNSSHILTFPASSCLLSASYFEFGATHRFLCKVFLDQDSDKENFLAQTTPISQEVSMRQSKFTETQLTRRWKENVPSM
jgi:hypothetical protein